MKERARGGPASEIEMSSRRDVGNGSKANERAAAAAAAVLFHQQSQKPKVGLYKTNPVDP